MIKRIKQFFSTETSNYKYFLPKDEVIGKIISLFKSEEKSLHYSDTNIKYLSNNSFRLTYTSVVFFRRWYSSKLYAEVNATDNDFQQTNVTINIKISWLIYLKFFIFLAVGVAYFIAFFVTHNIIALLNASILMLAIPAFYIWISSINNHAIKDRYLELIHKELRQTEKASTTKHN